jgi:hypothetical protein
MKLPPGQCIHLLANGTRCPSRAWKCGELYCMTHDIAVTLAIGAARNQFKKRAVKLRLPKQYQDPWS